MFYSEQHGRIHCHSMCKNKSTRIVKKITQRKKSSLKSRWRKWVDAVTLVKKYKEKKTRRKKEQQEITKKKQTNRKIHKEKRVHKE